MANSMMFIDKVVRKATVFTNITSAVKMKKIWIAYKSLKIGICYISILASLLLAVFPCNPPKSEPYMTCVLLMYNRFTGKMLESTFIAICLYFSSVWWPIIDCTLKLIYIIYLFLSVYLVVVLYIL